MMWKETGKWEIVVVKDKQTGDVRIQVNNVEISLDVEDTQTGDTKEYRYITERQISCWGKAEKWCERTH